MKGFIERAGMVSRTGGDLLKRKIGAAVVAVRRAGAIHAFDSMNHFFYNANGYRWGKLLEYWHRKKYRSSGERHGRHRDHARSGKNVAWLLKELHR